MFTTSWRNPGPEHAHWGLDDYVQSLLDAVEAVCDVAGSDKLNLRELDQLLGRAFVHAPAAQARIY